MFEWLEKKKDSMKGQIVDLQVNCRHYSFLTNELESISYDIFLHDSLIQVGICDLRLGCNEELYYAGNIGYRIYEKFRGNSYAYEACKILFSIAHKQYKMDELLITCSPDNIPSKKTCEKLDGQYVETVPVPKTHWLYSRGETIKNIYRYNLK